MIRRLFVICVVVAGSCLGVRAERAAGGGIVLYFKSGDQVYLLLADHPGSERGWAAFGGGSQEGESAEETAARETEQETRGYFLRADLLNAISEQEPVMDHNGFALYFAEIPFVPAQVVTNNPLPKEDKSYTERGPYAWVPYSELVPYLKGPVNSENRSPIEGRLLPGDRDTSWFWPVWLGNIRRAVETDSIPWTEEPQ